jgi:hypothetical protein
LVKNIYSRFVSETFDESKEIPEKIIHYNENISRADNAKRLHPHFFAYADNDEA